MSGTIQVKKLLDQLRELSDFKGVYGDMGPNETKRVLKMLYAVTSLNIN